MKKLFLLVTAAFLGGILTIGGYHMLGFNNKVIQFETASNPSNFDWVKNAATLPKTSANVPANFTSAAAKSMPSVVHIKAMQTAKLSRYNNRNDDVFEQFRQWFGDDFFSPIPDNYGGYPPQGRHATGSGVIFANDGYIVTNNHVVDGADELEVTTFDNHTYKATLIGTDPSTDLAVIKVENATLPKLEFANSDDAKVGEWVLAVGNPFNLSSTVTAGIISAKGRNLDILNDRTAIESFIQTDAAVNPGNSGGALVDTDGNLIGINTAIATPTGTYAGYSFAVPSKIVQKVIDDLMTYGVVQRGFLGVQIRDLTNGLSDELGLKITQGVYVDGFSPNSSAEQSGIKKGDVIVGVDGYDVKSAPELQELIGRRRPGDNVKVAVNRKGNLMDVVVQLKNANGKTDIVELEKSELFSDLGIEAIDLTDELKEQTKLENGIQITELRNGILTQRTDIDKGFIVTKIDGEIVKNLEDFKTKLGNKKEAFYLKVFTLIRQVLPTIMV